MLEAISNIITFVPWVIFSILSGIWSLIVWIVSLAFAIVLFPFKAVIGIISSVIIFFSPSPVAASSPPVVATLPPPAQTRISDYEIQTEYSLNYRDAMLEKIEKNHLVYFDAEIQEIGNHRQTAIVATEYHSDPFELDKDMVVIIAEKPMDALEGDTLTVIGRYAGIEKTMTKPMVMVDEYNVFTGHYDYNYYRDTVNKVRELKNLGDNTY